MQRHKNRRKKETFSETFSKYIIDQLDVCILPGKRIELECANQREDIDKFSIHLQRNLNFVFNKPQYTGEELILKTLLPRYFELLHNIEDYKLDIKILECALEPLNFCKVLNFYQHTSNRPSTKEYPDVCRVLTKDKIKSIQREKEAVEYALASFKFLFKEKCNLDLDVLEAIYRL